VNPSNNKPITPEQMQEWVEKTWQKCQDDAWASDPALHFCHRFAILMECVMLGGVDKYWDEMGTLLDEYHKARDAWATAQGQPYVSGFGKD
jgi:hypothetical protein